MVFQLDDKLWFPNPALGDSDGMLAVGGDHVLGVDAFGIVVHEWLRPNRTVQQFAELVPVQVKVLVMFIALLGGLDHSVVIVGIRGEVSAAPGEEIGLESDGTAVEVGVVLQNPA